MADRKYTLQEVIEAVQKANGLLAVAARQLGCSRQTVYNYVEKYSTVASALAEARETNIDFVEGQLMKAIRDGNVPAIMFFLKTVGKSRGYVERQEVTGVAGGEPIRMIEIIKDYGSEPDSDDDNEQ